MTRGDMPKGLTYYRKGGAASKKSKGSKLLSIVKTLTMPKAVRRKANG